MSLTGPLAAWGLGLLSPAARLQAGCLPRASARDEMTVSLKNAYQEGGLSEGRWGGPGVSA